MSTPPPPYRAQWESVDLVGDFIAGRDAATDPRWADSGAESAADYARWADHLCGCACLQMILAARGCAVPPIHALRRAVQAQGGYVEQADGTIRGLIYAGAVAWLAGIGVPARVVLDVDVAAIPAMLAAGGMLIGSVHPGIRLPDVAPASRGGHLVLVFGVTEGGALRLHNPSGHEAATRIDHRLAPETFARFFAGRGILVPGAVRSA